MKLRALSAGRNAAVLVPWLGRMAMLAMVALLGWEGAVIYWTLSAPESGRPSALMETDPQRVSQALTARHLFGVYVAASAAASAPSDIRLSGAIAAQKPGQRAYALLSVEGKPAQLVKEGEQAAPGITLQRVLARQVELLRGGQTLILSLPESNKAAEAGKGGAPAAVVIPAVPAAVVQPNPSQPPVPGRSRNRRSTHDDDT